MGQALQGLRLAQSPIEAHSNYCTSYIYVCTNLGLRALLEQEERS